MNSASGVFMAATVHEVIGPRAAVFQVLLHACAVGDAVGFSGDSAAVTRYAVCGPGRHSACKCFRLFKLVEIMAQIRHMKHVMTRSMQVRSFVVGFPQKMYTVHTVPPLPHLSAVDLCLSRLASMGQHALVTSTNRGALCRVCRPALCIYDLHFLPVHSSVLIVFMLRETWFR